MRKLHFFVLWVIILTACRSSAPGPDLATPVGWGKETFSLPPSFASSFPFYGKEIIRFAPGWSSKGRPDYWSYAFLWVLKDNPDVSTASLEKALTSYYTGLVGRNIEKLKIPAEKIIPVTAKLVQKQDSSWTGTVNMLDYLAQEPITLNFHITQRSGTDARRHCLFLEVSSASPSEGIWQLMDSLPAIPH